MSTTPSRRPLPAGRGGHRRRRAAFRRRETVEAFERALARMGPMPLSARMSPMSSALFYQLSASRSSARSASVPLIIDASQSAGSSDQLFRARAAFLPGHKGLTARRGQGCCSAAATLPLIGGGRQRIAASEHADFLPDRLERGRTTFLASRGSKRASPSCARSAGASGSTAARSSRRAEGLAKFQMYTVFSRWRQACRQGLIVHGGRPFARKCRRRRCLNAVSRCAQELHCAPFAHKTVGTLPDGTVRLSVSAFNRESEIDTFLSSLRAIAAGEQKTEISENSSLYRCNLECFILE